MNTRSVSISCLVDNQPRFRVQAFHWLQSLNKLGFDGDIYVHYTSGALSLEIRQIFRDLRANLVEVEPFGRNEAGYCNKLRQLDALKMQSSDFLILSDCDVFFLKDPSLHVRDGFFRAKQVDLENPKFDVCARLFRLAGLGNYFKNIAPLPLELDPGKNTFSTNFNGGLYIFPTLFSSALHDDWASYSKLCLEQRELLGDKRHHSDQIGMGMALIKNEIPTCPLKISENFPTHLAKNRYAHLSPVSISTLHYHQHVDSFGQLLLTGIDWIDSQIETVRKIMSGYVTPLSALLKG